VTELLRRLHELLRARLSTRAARIAATVLAVAGTAAVGVPLVRTSSSLAAQRVAILDALRECSAARRDPAAVQLIERGMVRVGDRDYGGPLVVGRPLDLFDGRGEMPAETKEDLSWRMLADQVPAWMPYALVKSPPAVAVLLAGALAAALGAVWAGFLLPALEGGLLVAAVTAFCWRMGWTAAAQWTVSAALCFLLFGFLWQSVRLLLSARGGPVAVAGNTALEGIRTLALPGFALPVALLLPFLALSRERGEALLQAIPAFLDWGHTVAYAFAAIFVILFGCATSAFEVRDRQVWSVVTKPVSGGGWLLGKWLGTLALGMTVVVGGTLLLGLGARYLAAQRPLDERDARDVRETVLIGRVGTLPEYQEMDAAALREAIDAEIESDGVMRADIANGLRDEAEIRRTIAARRKREFLDQQRRIGPGDSREFTFRGLGAAVSAGMPMSLRFRMHGAGDDEHQRFTTLFQWTSGSAPGVWEPRTWTPGDAYSMRIDPAAVDPDGTLRLRIWNLRYEEGAKEPVPNSITLFLQPNSLEVMVTESTFLGNLARAALVDLAKLAFLAALATVAGALLSLAPFLATALDHWAVDPKAGPVGVTLQALVFGIGTAVEWTLGAFAAQSPSDALAQGRAIAPGSLLRSVGGIGLGWTLLVVAAGWVALRRKEMAVYSGQS
jgi:hypothetical protein